MGIADTLIAKLGTSRDILVRPLASVRRFGELDQDPQATGPPSVSIRSWTAASNAREKIFA